jgi:aminoglycoside phosphotransferase (APT) family kinase protein
LHGGFWAEIFAFELADPPRGFEGELVLRLMPDAARAKRESAVHAVVAEAGFATPRVRAAGDASGGLGRAFIVMDRIAGGSIAGGLPLRERLAALPRVPVFLAGALLELHALPAAALRERLAARGLPTETLGVDALLAELERTIAALAASDLAHALDGLHKTRRRESDTVLCHGDMHAFNLILRDGQVAAVIDWTNARLAEPEFDVAYSALLLEQLPIDAPAFIRPLLRRAGRHAARRFVAEYRKRRALDPDKLAWYDALHALAGLVRVRLAGSGLPGTTALADSHPWVRMAPANAARLLGFVSRAR